MLFARRVFQIAGIAGLLAVVPLYLLEGWVGRVNPPAINHPEIYYASIGVTLAWQVAFLVIARDPVRYRPLMIPAVLEKATFGFGMVALYLGGRISATPLVLGLTDLTLGVLFILAYWRLRSGPPGPSPRTGASA
jgi:hypothetical protein